MKIDKEKIAAMAALPDEELWKKVREIAKENGIKLPEKDPTAKDMQALKAVLLSGERINPLAAAKLISNLKRGREDERK